jgi:hypothetical protein
MEVPIPEAQEDDATFGNPFFLPSGVVAKRWASEEPVTEEQLAAFESRHGLRFPDDYRRFLVQYNGGEPTPNRVSFIKRGRTRGRRCTGLVVDFAGVYTNGGAQSLESAILRSRDEMPAGHVGIAWDSNGNEWVLCVDGEKAGTVYFWHHENEAPDGEPPWFDNMSFVANSFTAFLDALHTP